MTLSIHHATAKKAEKLGVTLTIEGDRVIAIDTENDPDREFSGTNAKDLLDRVLSLRPGADSDGDDEGDDEGDEQDEGDGEEGDDADEGDGEGTADADDEDEPAESGSIVKPKYRQAYEVFDGTCGDAFAEAFTSACRNGEGEFDIDALRSVASTNGIDLDARWGHLNVGQRRMNLSNVLRGMVRRGEKVTVGSQPFEPELDSEGKPTKAIRAVTTRGVVK